MPILLFTENVFAQQTYSVSGRVSDPLEGIGLPGATVIDSLSKKGTVTDIEGNFTLDLPSGPIVLQVSYIGFATQVRSFNLNGNRELDIEIKPAGETLKSVTVSANSLREQMETGQMGVAHIDMRDARDIPAIFGEVDIIKTLQLKPGVQAAGEGFSGLYVRGGGPDQNLFLLDGATVYNPTHLFGLFSTFNADAIRSVDLYKGGFPAQFGGRLSSVLDIKGQEGSKDEYGVSGGIGLISSRLSVDGPIDKGKGSFLVAGRRTYFDVFTRMYNKTQADDPEFDPIPDYFFYDLNGKMTYDLNKKDRISLSAYYGRDVFGFSNNGFEVDFDWGNTVISGNWYHSFTDRLLLTTTASYSDYDYKIENSVRGIDLRVGSRVTDYQLASELSWFSPSGHRVRTGLSGIWHDFNIGRLSVNNERDKVSFGTGSYYSGQEFGAFVSDNYDLSRRIKLTGGLRLSGFNNNGSISTGLEPRFSSRYLIDDKTSVKGSYASMNQYVHLVSNSGASLPTDIWYPSNDKVRPQRSQQVAAGASRLLANGNLLLSNEVYYKWMNRQIDFRDGAQLFANPDLDEEFVFGNAYAYGNEIYLEKKNGRLHGWIGYTLSWTFRKFDAINNGEPYNPRYDRRHDLSVVGIYDLSDRLTLSSTFIYGSGNAVSLPVGRFAVQDVIGSTGFVIPEYLERNSFRMPGYHRMDLGLVWKLKPKKGSADLTFSIYNAYNRRNPYFIYFEEVKDEADDNTIAFKARQVALFPILPAITYNFRF